MLCVCLKAADCPTERLLFIGCWSLSDGFYERLGVAAPFPLACRHVWGFLVSPLQPVPEELQNGEGFGYVVAFRPLGVTSWIQTVVTSPDTPRYVFRNDSIVPFSLYEVKVGVYNNKGEGPFSPVTTVFSAEEGTRSTVLRSAAAPIPVTAHTLLPVSHGCSHA